MIHYIEGEITKQTTVDLIEFLEKAHPAPSTIYLSSHGGSLQETLIITHILNHHTAPITLIASSYIASGAFQIFFDFTGTKQLLPGTRGMYHQGSFELQVNYDGKLSYHAHIKLSKNAKKTYLVYQHKLCKRLGFTKKEMRRMKKGYDVFFDYERMVEMMKANNKKNIDI